MAGFAVDDRLYALNIRLPSSVGTSVRVRNLDSESNTFAADVAFCHCLHLLCEKHLKLLSGSTVLFYQIANGKARVFLRFF